VNLSSLAARAARALRLRGRRDARTRASEQEHFALLGELYRTAFPVWERHLLSATGEGARAASSLVAQFEAIVQRLEQALERSRKAATGAVDARDIVKAVGSTKDQLAAIVRSLEQAQLSKQRVLASIGAYSAELGEMATDVRQVATHIHLLSLNATIEAARAGEAGKPFSVVVQEMRQLSARAGETGSRMTKRVESITASVEQMTREAQAEHDERGRSIREAERVVERVIDTSAALAEQLGQQVAEMQTEAEAVRASIGEAMVALQFEDRVNQIVSHVAADVRKMRETCETGSVEGRTESWLAEMSATLSTPEEFDNLRPGARAVRDGSAPVTFFS
jgi:methyl-accepting chemotaxis protein